MYASVTMIGKRVRVNHAAMFGGETVSLMIESDDGDLLDLHLPAEFYAEMAAAAANATPYQRPAS